MFEQSFVSSKGVQKPWTIAVAFLGQAALVGILVLIPLIYYQALPAPQLVSFLVAPSPPPPPPPPPAAAAVHPTVEKVIPRQFQMGRLIAPTVIPKQVATIKDLQPPPSFGIAGGVPGGQLGGVIGGILNSVTTAAPPPPPPPPAPKPAVKPAAPKVIRVGGQVEAANLIHKVLPAYPPLAKVARVQGTVRLTAVIAKDGTIQSLRVVSGQPLLVPAALAAVKQWVYKPTLLNGQPAEVITEIDVNFRAGSAQTDGANDHAQGGVLPDAESRVVGGPVSDLAYRGLSGSARRTISQIPSPTSASAIHCSTTSGP